MAELPGAAALERTLDRLSVRGSVYCLFEGLEDWGLRLPEAPAARFHAVLDGGCWLGVGDDPPIRIGEGELILLPQGDRHDVLSLPKSPVVDVTVAFGNADPYQKVFRMGSGEHEALLVCGGFEFENSHFHPLLSCLPRVMRLQANTSASSALRQILELAHEELRGPHLASEVVLGRLSEILFITAVRVFAADLPDDQTGWLAALGNPAVGKALAAIHSDPGRSWSVDDLARCAGVSKTTLTERFQELVGEPPGRYLTRWRMLEGRRLLGIGDLTVAQVGERVGYSSEAAFSRAFQREVGRWPSECREAPSSR